ncbi:hypothetical protein R70723_26515 [Paenibacillus sp. FSL R7-0273]|uniref:DUF269 domain-containing protein n=1 Tax=Paenibacillus sp. FSL R7-0273 TaxID=1536772 RepID=UPI0004F8562C|nr:DUF269 domain-containing protein [Paenibacillus sp. FSL R7-0273]AIQ49059.1 hypothetical protein R70723_26515 [Paenibacillus sp. FSL R7-0273]OMF90616.1 hypothetical protein BK144_17555 [Paenibacillus sp. FSL R7-0273]
MEPMANESPAALEGAYSDNVLQKRRSRPGRKAVDQEMADALVRRLCGLLDAEDFFGRYAALTPGEKLAQQFLASAKDQSQSEFNCAVSPKVRQQVPLLFQAAAGVIEERSGTLIQSTAEINGEGFGRGLLYSGRVILVLKSLRAGFPFPFTSEEKVIRYGVECAEEGLAFLAKYREVTALHGLMSLEG